MLTTFIKSNESTLAVVITLANKTTKLTKDTSVKLSYKFITDAEQLTPAECAPDFTDFISYTLISSQLNIIHYGGRTESIVMY